MERVLGGVSELLYAALRFFAGAMFACHGAQKLFGAFGGGKATGSPLMLTAGIIELVGGLLIAFGLLAGWAAFVAAGEMAVAYFMVHASKGPWPIKNGGELAVLYCFVFLFIASRGSGTYSIEGASRGRGRRRR